MVPLSPRIGVRGRLRACKGEGEKKQRDAPAPRRRCIPLVWYWREGGLVEVVESGGVAAGDFGLFFFGDAGEDFVEDLAGPGEG